MDKKLLSGIVILFLLIPLCAMLIRILVGSESVADYAKNHPQQQVVVTVTPDAEGVENEK